MSDPAIPTIPRTNLPVPLEALPRSVEELAAAASRALGTKAKRDPGLAKAVVNLFRSTAVFVCNAKDSYGAKPSTVVERFLTLLGVDIQSACLSYATSLRASDGRYTKEYVVYVADLSKRLAHEPGADLSILVVCRRYQRCWYGTFAPFVDMGVQPAYEPASPDNPAGA